MDVVNLPHETVTRLIVDDDYCLGFANAINNYFKEHLDPEGLGISDESLSAEIWGHLLVYRAAQLGITPSITGIPASDNALAALARIYAFIRTKEIDVGDEEPEQRNFWNNVGRILYGGEED